MYKRQISQSSDPNNGTLFQDSSDVAFEVKMPTPDITVVNPNGGQTLNALSTYTITWTNGASVSGLYRDVYKRQIQQLILITLLTTVQPGFQLLQV